VTVPEAMATFQSKEEQLNIASLSAHGVGNPNSSVSSVEQAVLRSEENIDLTTTTDVAISRGLAIAERSATRSPINREGIQTHQLHADDREATGCERVHSVDSELPSTTFVDGDKSVGEKATNAVEKLDDGAREVDCRSYLTESLAASATVSPESVEPERLTTETVGGWRRLRGRGRGRIISLSASASSVCDTAVGSRSMKGIGRGRARSIMRQFYVGIDKDSSIEWAVGRLERGTEAETSGSGGAAMFQPCEHLDPERSFEVEEAGAVGGGKPRGAPGVISARDQECSGDVGEFSDGHFQLISTPTHSQTISNESHLLAETLARPPAEQLDSMSLPAVVSASSCQGCKALQVSNQRLNVTVAAMEIKLSKLSEMVTELSQRLDQMSKQKISKPSSRQSDEPFTDERLMRIKAAAFIIGRPLSAHMCKHLVLNIYDNEPPCTFNSDDIKSINDRRECRDAQSLSKWAVFEMFSLRELVGRNCLGGGHDTSANGNADIKKPFDEHKMQIIKNAVFTLYPQQNDAMRKAVWMKCVDKINTDVRYLFKVSLKKHEWLQLGF